MDIVEFAEKFMNVELKEWQKRHIRTLYEVSRDNDIRVVFGRYGRVYTYIMPKQQELIRHG